MTISTNKFIDLMVQDVMACRAFAEQYWLTADEESLNWKSPEFGWSVSDIMQHLSSFSTFFLPEMEKAIKQGQETDAVPKEEFTFDQQLESFFQVLSYEGLDAMKAKGHFKEIELYVSDYFQGKIPDFISIQDNLLDLLIRAKTVNLETLSIPAIIKPQTNFRLGDGFQFVIRHQILHFAQAEKTMQAFSQTVNRG